MVNLNSLFVLLFEYLEIYSMPHMYSCPRSALYKCNIVSGCCHDVMNAVTGTRLLCSRSLLATPEYIPVNRLTPCIIVSDGSHSSQATGSFSDTDPPPNKKNHISK